MSADSFVAKGFQSLKRWFYSDLKSPQMSPQDPDSVDWVRNLPYFTMYAMCIFVFWVGISWPAVLTACGLYFIRMFAITGWYHRYFSHRTFKTSRPVQFAMGFLGATSVQRGPIWWAAHHRHHHAHSDEECDAHSPHHHNFLYAHLLWFTTRKNYRIKDEMVKDLLRFPELRWLERLDVIPPIVLAFATLYWGKYLASLGYNTSGFQMLVWGFFISSVILYQGTFSINTLTHLIGNKRFKTKDESRNSLILALITLGEGWHNNHHHFPGSTRQGFYWWEIDISYYLIKIMSWLGLVWDIRPVPDAVKQSKLLKS